MMKKEYKSPTLEAIDLYMEDPILTGSGIQQDIPLYDDVVGGSETQSLGGWDSENWSR